MRRGVLLLAGIVALGLLAAPQAPAQSDKNQAAKKGDDGKWVLPDGTPTFNIQKDGTVDWYTYSGFRRYHSECHVCHGPDGLGSTYAPPIVDSIKAMAYSDFLMVVASGRENVGAAKQSVMPALGDNPNVMCYVDDIYIYLKARAEGGLPRGRPPKRVPKPEAASEHEKQCFGN